MFSYFIALNFGDQKDTISRPVEIIQYYFSQQGLKAEQFALATIRTVSFFFLLFFAVTLIAVRRNNSELLLHISDEKRKVIDWTARFGLVISTLGLMCSAYATFVQKTNPELHSRILDLSPNFLPFSGRVF